MNPKILMFDIETFPATAYIWRLKQDYIPINMVKEEGKICMWAAKWLDEKKVITSTYRDDGEKKCVQKLHDLMSEADILVAHNGDRFDIKEMNSYFLKFGLTPPAPSKSRDTLKIARANFNILSNKLDHLAKFLGVGAKLVHTGFDMWKGCMANRPESWKMMIKYNIRDVKILEAVYLKLRAWDKSATNNAVYIDPKNPTCKTCSSTNLQKRGVAVTGAGKYQRYQCLNCGKWLRSRQKMTVNNPNILA